MTDEPNNVSAPTFLSKVWLWVKKNWLWILIIPTALFVLWRLGQFISQKLIKPAKPELGGSDDLVKSIDEKNKIEQDQLSQIENTKDKTDDAIDAGGPPTPAEVFNQAIRGKR
jgi:hypothetical protein